MVLANLPRSRSPQSPPLIRLGCPGVSKAGIRRTNLAQAAQTAIKTSSLSSSSVTPSFSLPPYSPGNGHGALSFSPRTLLSPCVLASTILVWGEGALSTTGGGAGAIGGLFLVLVDGAGGADAVGALLFRGLRAMPR